VETEILLDYIVGCFRKFLTDFGKDFVFLVVMAKEAYVSGYRQVLIKRSFAELKALDMDMPNGLQKALVGRDGTESIQLHSAKYIPISERL
jgi:hypothetical protein